MLSEKIQSIKDHFSIYSEIYKSSVSIILGATLIVLGGAVIYKGGEREALKKIQRIPSQLEINITQNKGYIQIDANNSPEDYIFPIESKDMKIKCDLQPHFKCELEDDKYNTPVVLEKKVEKQ
ncbi:MAG: hypothetical protein PHD81_00185 [Candidatus Nanoarchaeia archaeon]|nr:hypothetical protein [Candidatus Nanoarchaeia archaeon]MDD5587510.1 hypothetical protein [Candidatus Nanoarchaeia archaeon]